jgi:hypothetical protein
MSNQKPTFGILMLLLGMVIGFSLGVIVAKQDHNVLWVIVGPIVGAVAADCLKSWSEGKLP